MHELSNGPFIHYMFTRFMEGDNKTKIDELDKLIEFCEEYNFNHAATAAYNYKGYLLKYEGNLEAAAEAIQRGVNLHPDGYNPVDSRAEFYLYAGDTVKAISTYHKVLEKYPYAQYTLDQLKKLE